jgi:hypothetical protein
MEAVDAVEQTTGGWSEGLSVRYVSQQLAHVRFCPMQPVVITRAPRDMYEQVNEFLLGKRPVMATNMPRR